MRAWILCACLVSACDGGGGCLIDSDCADFSMVCIDEACVPVGSVRLDSGAPMIDAGGSSDGGNDAGPVVADAGRDASTAACPDASGGYSIGSLAGTCNVAMVGYFVNVNSPAGACQFTAASAIAGMSALDGAFTMDAAGALTGSMSAGGAPAEICSGTLTGGVLTVICGACTLTLNAA